MTQYVDDVTAEDIDTISAKLKRKRLDEQEPRGEVHLPYPCDEHRHFRCTVCNTVVCGREYGTEPFKSEGEHERLCTGDCGDTIQTFEPHKPSWVEA